MKTFFKKIWNVKFHIVSVAILVLSLVLTFTNHNQIVHRCWGAIKNFGQASVNAFKNFFLGQRVEAPTSSLTNYVDLVPALPFDTAELMQKLEFLGKGMLQWSNFKLYSLAFIIYGLIFILVCLVVVMIVIMAMAIFSTILLTPADEDMAGNPTKALVFFQNKIEKPCNWVFSKLKRFCSRFYKTKKYLVPFCLIWCFNLNLFSIMFEFFALYLTVIVEPNFEFVGRSSATFLLDVVLVFFQAPLLFWVVVGLFVSDKVRKAIAYDKLDHMVCKDMGFIKSLSLAVMLIGTMGVSKTLTITVMLLLNSIIMHDNAYATLHKFQMAFPDFPFLKLEKAINEKIKNREIKNLFGIRRYIRSIFKAYNKGEDTLFGYKGPLQFNNGLAIVTLKKALTEYSQAYYIYSLESSLLITTYGVREDIVRKNIGNFTLWDTKLFKRKPEDSKTESHYSHILDFDILRLGEKVDKKNKFIGSFEFGLLGIPEYGKERGNQFKTKGMKSDDNKANQLNDLLSYMLKLFRHPSTIDYEPYARIFVDEQRCMSLNADERELFDLINIKEKKEVQLAMPGFFLGELINSTIIKWFKKFWGEVRYNGQEKTLPAYLLLKPLSAFKW